MRRAWLGSFGVIGIVVALFSGCSSTNGPTNRPGFLAVRDTVAFGIVPAGQTRDTSIRISNTGGDDLTINGEAANSTQIRDSNFLQPLTLTPGDYRDVHISFTPATSGASATDSIKYLTDGKSAVATILFMSSGTGGGGGGGGSQLVAVPSLVNFGSLPIGQWHDTTVFLVNGGYAPIVITSAVMSGQEGRDTTVMPVVLTSGQSRLIHVAFNPSQAGARSVTDQFTYVSNGVTSTAVLTLQAQGGSGGGGGGGGGTGGSPGAGSTFTYDTWQTDTNGVAGPHSDSTYTVTSNSLTYQGKTNVLAVRGPSGDITYYHSESNGDFSIFIDLTSVEALLAGAGFPIALPSRWMTIPLGSHRTVATVLYDTSVTYQGAPVNVVISDTGKYLGATVIPAAGKNFQTDAGSLSLAFSAMLGGFIPLYAVEDVSAIWYSKTLGFYAKRQDVAGGGGVGQSSKATSANWVLKSYVLH